jgi:hypothetical protein
MTALEAKEKLSRGLIGKLVSGRQRHASTLTLAALSRALGVSAAWLALGEGAPPKLTGPLASRFDGRSPWQPAPDPPRPSGLEPWEPTPRPTPQDDWIDPSPDRAAAVAFARANKINETAIARVRALPDREYSPEEWYTRIKAEADELWFQEHELKDSLHVASAKIRVRRGEATTSDRATLRRARREAKKR